MCIYCITGFKEFCECEDSAAETPSIEARVDALFAAVETEEKVEKRVPSNTISAGRKRGSRKYQIPDGLQCEWAGLRSAGGGIVPIVGCRPEQRKLARGKHHGPDKSTQNNDRSNVHFICATCHNRWHTLNNEKYGAERPEDNGTWLPLDIWMPAFQKHNSTLKATEEDFVENDKFWAHRKVWKADDYAGRTEDGRIIAFEGSSSDGETEDTSGLDAGD